MSNVKLRTPSNGSVTLSPQDTASDVVLTVPATSTSVLAGSGFNLSASAPANTFVTDSSGNVGIGTDSPLFRTDIRAPNEAILNIYNTAATSNDSVGAQISAYNGTYWNYIYSNASSFRWSTYNTERMRIDSSGRFLVGTTGVSFNSVANFVFNGFSNGVETTWSGTSSIYHLLCINGNGLIGGIQTSGSTTSFLTSSDYRLKENVQPMQNALARVAQLKPVTYTWKADGSDGQGFIAHELQAVVPDCVTGEKDAVDADGNPRYQGVDTSFLVATLTAAIQEQQAMITQLQSRIEALENA